VPPTGSPAERREDGRVCAAAHAEFHPAPAEGVQHGRVLSHPDRVFEGEGHHRRAQVNVPGPLCDGGQEGERGGEPPGSRVEMVLRDPGGVEAQFLGGDEEFHVIAVELAWRHGPVQVREESETKLRGHEGPLSGR
jgi:hypothetical protein